MRQTYLSVFVLSKVNSAANIRGGESVKLQEKREENRKPKINVP